MKTINVPLDELKPGDTVTIPPLVVSSVNKDSVYGSPIVLMHDDCAFYLAILKSAKATAAREVPDPDYPLTWAEALDQMVTHGRMCKPDCEDCRYRYAEGVWRTYPSLSDDRWVEILLHLSTAAQRRLTKAKWRIEDENG